MKEELTIKELLGIVCARWRMLLVLAVIFALLLGGYRTYSSFKALPASAEVTQMQEADRLARESYTRKQELLQEEIRQLGLQAEAAEFYNENSLLMKLSPYNKEVAKLTFCVNVDMADLEKDMPENWQSSTSASLIVNRQNRIISQYKILADGASLSTLMAGTDYADVEERFLKELVNLRVSEHGMLTIEVCSTAVGSGAELAQRIYEFCSEKQDAVAQIAGNHTLAVLDTGSVIQIDLELANMQRQAQNRPVELMLQIAGKTKELNELVLPQDVAINTSASAIKSGMQYAILGAAAGLCIGAVIAFLAATMGAKLSDGIALARTLGCRYLGNLKAYRPKKGLDAWAEKLMHADVFDLVVTEDRLPLLAANIKDAAEEKRALLLTGTCPQAELEALATELSPLLGDEYRLSAAANLLISAEAIRKLGGVDGVVVVENEKTARIEGVLQTRQYLEEAKKALIGAVWA